MAIAWSKISSKFIANPPCARQCAGDRVGRGDPSGHRCTANDRQRKAGSVEAHGAAETSSPKRAGKVFAACACTYFNHKKLIRSEGPYHDSQHTRRQKTRQSQTPAPPASTGAP